LRLLDTNVFVSFLRGHPPAVRYIEGLKGRDDVAFSAITECELLTGSSCDDERKRRRVIALLGQWRKIDVTNPIAVRAGDIKRTKGLSVLDALIAATALQAGAELVTSNVKHFRIVEGLKVVEPPF
jgi:hypothetical protein